ncbi:hypothetical protein Pmar_PMAR015874 [Perkinsus marinus ATCC 50983]|uniref:Uncharacterized protein n=1 Tax=Perkinsus marinus (strain ATCC 50983 / TXsc) TaxID=423536 RepID=C5K8C7_PERM5|nr:hypothetical protein Pmar_PMAR015874 [Perkinsus marinus ATCC 50983]EER19315.1 hypothetical protein Pmar_PMAR015874 [Perkinsus marinus ATCC 50983]|eukprot:XP_002787519.1 hypothetical protein Pmar_PMAR015874 [Perkinsus marinus ATCC 50983]
MLVDIPTLNADRLSAKQLSNFAATSTPVIIKGLRMPHIDLLAILQLEASNKTISVAPLQANKTDKWLEQMRDWVPCPVETGAVVFAVSGRRMRISLSDFIANIDRFYADGAGNGSKSWKFLADYIGRRCDVGKIDAMLDGPLERHIWLGPSSTQSSRVLSYDKHVRMRAKLDGGARVPSWMEGRPRQVPQPRLPMGILARQPTAHRMATTARTLLKAKGPATYIFTNLAIVISRPDQILESEIVDLLTVIGSGTTARTSNMVEVIAIGMLLRTALARQSRARPLQALPVLRARLLPLHLLAALQRVHRLPLAALQRVHRLPLAALQRVRRLLQGRPHPRLPPLLAALQRVHRLPLAALQRVRRLLQGRPHPRLPPLLAALQRVHRLPLAALQRVRRLLQGRPHPRLPPLLAALQRARYRPPQGRPRQVPQPRLPMGILACQPIAHRLATTARTLLKAKGPATYIFTNLAIVISRPDQILESEIVDLLTVTVAGTTARTSNMVEVIAI